MKQVDEILDMLLPKIDRAAAEAKGRFPHITDHGRWGTTPDGWWTGGYWVGLLWLAYLYSKREKYLIWAQDWSSLLAPRKNELNYDMGHLFYPSFVLGHEITGDENYKKIALEAAGTLTTVVNRKTGFIYREIEIGGKKAGRAFIDTMATLPLLWWAYNKTGDERYHDVAHTHSMRTIKNFIRKGGSTTHVIDFDLETGRIIRKTTWQGYSKDSCWSRGQAWGIYGFVLAYKATGEKVFLGAAEELAGYFIRNLPSDFVPYWDFDDPKIPNASKDSSAAAIACSGLITLSRISRKKRFGVVADRILSSLSTNYVAGESSDAMLEHGCFHMPKKIGVDAGLIWGDYYFMEALVKSGGVLEVGE